MGEVYRADDLRVGQVVALKLMSEALARRVDGLERLTAEVRLARSVVHPNVCRVYDIGHAEGWHYLSMEYVDGETLASLLRRIGQPPLAKALEMARQLCAGVAAAHGRGVLHRDLKPSNVMVDGRGQIRIMDFGLAVNAADDVREVAGTPAYMPPEQLSGQPVTPQSDLYALGRVLLEILPPETDRSIVNAARSCVAADPSERPHSARALLAVLPAGDLRPIDNGTIPTPAILAAAATDETMRPRTAWLLLASIVLGALGVASQAHIYTVAPGQVPKPPEVLAERGREILAQRTSAPTVDRAFWWSAPEGENRVLFTYRESAVPLVPVNIFRVVTLNDPPPSDATRTVTLHADGTESVVHPIPPSPFASGRSPLGETVLWIGIVIGFVAGSILARRNLRAGEGDRAGAWKLSLVVAVGGVLGATLRAHHVPSFVDEMAWLLVVLGWSVVWGAFSWLAYISFEPYVRRWWPHTLVSWSRLLRAQPRDPLVGRDLLLGAGAGVISAAMMLIQFGGADAPPTVFRQAALEALHSPRLFASIALLSGLNALQFALGGIAGLVLLRLIVRRTWIAVMVFVALGVPLFAESASASAIAFTAFGSLFRILVMLRVSILAFVTMLIVMHLLTWLPLTLDGDAWYFGRSTIVLLLIGSVALYGFLGALAGRPAFGVLTKVPSQVS
jgi:serine/threonine protein kinase